MARRVHLLNQAKSKPVFDINVLRANGDASSLAFIPADDAPLGTIAGDAGSKDALKILLDNMNVLQQSKTLELLKAALLAYKKGEWKKGCTFAIEALNIDEKNALGWHILAVGHDKANDLLTALTCYETALRLKPEDLGIANDLGRLAVRMNIPDSAEKLFNFVLRKDPAHAEAANNLGTALRESSRYDEAIEVLRAALGLNPGNAQLWNTLGTVVNTQGDMATALIFYDEALRLQPDNAHALYNRGLVRGMRGDYPGSVQDMKKAIPLFLSPMEIENCELGLAFNYAAMGQLEKAWRHYDGRHKDGTLEKMHFLIDRPRWTPKTEIKNKHVLVCAEQGLGDEVLFSGVLPDLIEDLGADGRLTLAVETRLVPLFQRSFPRARVIKHHTTKFKGQIVRLFPDLTEPEEIDCWALMADLLKKYRKTVESFPPTNAFLIPDPQRVTYWKGQLDSLGREPKIGIVWKSMIRHSRRDRFYSPFEQWKSVLETKGVHFINLQYGDVSEELAQADAEGLTIRNPPGIDLKQDIDDLCALTCAMDVVVGPSNATLNFAAGAGVKTWLITPGSNWHSLGTDHYPWYPSVELIEPKEIMDWAAAMKEVKHKLDLFLDSRSIAKT